MRESAVERIVRAILEHGGKVQAVFSVEGVDQVWDLAGVEEGTPRVEFNRHGEGPPRIEFNNQADKTMDAKALEDLPMGRGDKAKVFYHRTTEEGWLKIQQEGVLYGATGFGRATRCTYLAPFDWGDSYGPVLLKVKYTPCGKRGVDNYCFDRPFGKICTQFAVFEPIPLDKVERVEEVD